MTDQSFIPPLGGPINYESPLDDPRYRKYRTGGMVFGIIAIVMGSFSGCLGLIVPLALLVPQPPSAPPRTVGVLLAGVLVYVAMAVTLIWIGIGAMKMRRWVRPLILTLGTLTLLCGIFMVLFFAVGWKSMVAAAAANNPNQRQAPMIGVFLFFTALVMGFFTIVVPGAFIWFYKSARLKEALEYYDPVTRWTDKSPVPVLGLAIALVGLAGSMLLSLARPMAAVFGTVLHRPPAMVFAIGLAATALVLARLVYRNRISGWWGTLAFLLFITISYSMTSLRPDQESLYKAAGFTEQELNAMRSFQLGSLGVRLAIQLPFFLLSVGYLAYVRKFFKTRIGVDAASIESP